MNRSVSVLPSGRTKQTRTKVTRKQHLRATVIETKRKKGNDSKKGKRKKERKKERKNERNKERRTLSQPLYLAQDICFIVASAHLLVIDPPVHCKNQPGLEAAAGLGGQGPDVPGSFTNEG